jgi:hypothetical protein
MNSRKRLKNWGGLLQVIYEDCQEDATMDMDACGLSVAIHAVEKLEATTTIHGLIDVMMTIDWPKLPADGKEDADYWLGRLNAPKLDVFVNAMRQLMAYNTNQGSQDYGIAPINPYNIREIKRMVFIESVIASGRLDALQFILQRDFVLEDTPILTLRGAMKAKTAESTSFILTVMERTHGSGAFIVVDHLEDVISPDVIECVFTHPGVAKSVSADLMYRKMFYHPACVAVQLRLIKMGYAFPSPKPCEDENFFKWMDVLKALSKEGQDVQSIGIPWANYAISKSHNVKWVSAVVDAGVDLKDVSVSPTHPEMFECLVEHCRVIPPAVIEGSIRHAIQQLYEGFLDMILSRTNHIPSPDAFRRVFEVPNHGFGTIKALRRILQRLIKSGGIPDAKLCSDVLVGHPVSMAKIILRFA